MSNIDRLATSVSKAEECMSYHIQKLHEVCNKNDNWDLAFCAVSQNYLKYECYCKWLKSRWPGYSPITQQEFLFIKEMYSA